METRLDDLGNYNRDERWTIKSLGWNLQSLGRKSQNSQSYSKWFKKTKNRITCGAEE